MSQIKDNIAVVRKLLEQKVSTEDIDGMLNYYMDLKDISGLSAANMANAKIAWRDKQKETIEKLIEDAQTDGAIDLIKVLPASTVNDLIKAKCGEFEAQYELSDRIDKRLSYTMEGLRTAISFRKAELEKGI